MTMPPDPPTPAAGVQRTAAIETRGRWPGLVWALPLAAFLIVAYFGLQALAHNGVDVVVTFDSAADAKPGDTQVVYKGLSVGHVTKVRLDGDGRHVDMTLKLDPSTGRCCARERSSGWLGPSPAWRTSTPCARRWPASSSAWPRGMAPPPGGSKAWTSRLP